MAAGIFSVDPDDLEQTTLDEPSLVLFSVEVHRELSTAPEGH